ncbi:MAG TPA: phytanoyl-CoA dioxygenase [Lentisphaeria bacterium]|nr:phytanoyl-CoA dioxygenase [Lentisphaeria bacterium]|tara:strand:+ start:4358 stop:5197 length:840 start_codon:yes stop_codon:yes gene_type:complete
MTTELSDKQIQSYDRNGFLVFENFLDSSELAHWRNTLDQAVAERLRTQAEAPADAEMDYYKKVFVQCVNLWKTSDAIRTLILDPRIGKLAATLAGTAAIRMYHDHALIKPPWGNPTNWHIDNPEDPFHSRQQIMVWVALDEATMQNGCLCFLPGAHKLGDFDVKNNFHSGDVGGLFRDRPELYKIEPSMAPMSAGDCVFISGMVPHAAGANMTPRPRRAMACLLMPEEARYNGNPSSLPREYADTLAVGDPLVDDRYVPQLWPVAELYGNACPPAQHLH